MYNQAPCEHHACSMSSTMLAITTSVGIPWFVAVAILILLYCLVRKKWIKCCQQENDNLNQPVEGQPAQPQHVSFMPSPAPHATELELALIRTQNQNQILLQQLGSQSKQHLQKQEQHNLEGFPRSSH